MNGQPAVWELIVGCFINVQPCEIIDLAVQIEEKGAEFYKKLAEKAETESARELLLFLAAEEEKHRLDFLRSWGKIFKR